MNETETLAAPALSEEQVEAWRADGYVMVEDVLTTDEIAAAVEESYLHVPTRDEYDRASEAGPATSRQPCPVCRQPLVAGQGLAWMNSPPFKGDTLNNIPFHPRLLAIAEQLLGTPDLRLTQSLLRATYCGPETVDQELHYDYGNNTLLTPRTDGAFGQLPTILYLTDVTIDDAPTYAVSNRHAPDRPIAGALTEDEKAELYAHEVPLIARAGTVILYTMHTWHRGSVGKNPNGLRLVIGPVYRAAGSDWMDHVGWSSTFYTDDGRRCIERLTPRQREVLGIPAPGHPFWNEETIAGFAARYPAADPEPYWSKLNGSVGSA